MRSIQAEEPKTRKEWQKFWHKVGLDDSSDEDYALGLTSEEDEEVKGGRHGNEPAEPGKVSSPACVFYLYNVIQKILNNSLSTVLSQGGRGEEDVGKRACGARGQ